MENFTWSTFLIFLAIGFVAQLVDGSMGMAYGVTTNSILLSIGILPSVASASVHISKIFTTLVSGLSHLKFKNSHNEIIKSLILPGMIGGVLGAILLVKIPSSVIKPIVSVYLLIMGVRIFLKAFSHTPGIQFRKIHYQILGVCGGFFDAIGGGGWGPIVTSSLLSQDEDPRKIIGSVNIVEFFVTITESAVLIAGIGLAPISIVLGLILGGILAAPLAAFLTSKIPVRAMYIIIGSVIVLMQVYIFMTLFGFFG